MTTGFRREVDENRAVLGNYATSSGIHYRPSGTTYRSHLQVLPFGLQNSNDTIGYQNRDLPACSAVPEPTAPQSESFYLLIVGAESYCCT